MVNVIQFAFQHHQLFIHHHAPKTIITMTTYLKNMASLMTHFSQMQVNIFIWSLNIFIHLYNFPYPFYFPYQKNLILFSIPHPQQMIYINHKTKQAVPNEQEENIDYGHNKMNNTLIDESLWVIVSTMHDKV